ncbi:GDSL-type esterase/lipase family protein [Acidisphaera rubrifaciens]|uniref:SGNH hydrolase-type esterase domain-containing protein n=1 Tax=Acidisphaera rubrifaciens HS-AP3 TaxID=1231350 RepID=A0A0D6P7M9_9PROT|nr:GDSL-type esterase/lipase family protein [Acidisphaera rubrifaciens]GAN77351.1 hypothetical protein Asru_0289_01 [Acidisphaera rubrifaciens HS-AP3]
MRWFWFRVLLYLRGRFDASADRRAQAKRADDAAWLQRLAAKRAEAASWRGRALGLVFLGDSITQNWELAGPPDWADFAPVWNRLFAPHGALNLGYAGDATGNLLWRLRDGELDGLAPRAVVLLIGVNDILLHGHSAPSVVAGIDAILVELNHRVPDARVLVLGLLPSRVSGWVSRQSKAVNAALASRNWSGTKVDYLDVGNVLLAKGRPDARLYCDRDVDPALPLLLHPNRTGQERIGIAINMCLQAHLT